MSTSVNAQGSFSNILSKIRKESKSMSELGKKFERITKDFFEIDAQYSKRFASVQLWDDWQYRDGHDTGIDLMAKQKDGDWCAIQCKCYADDGSLNLKAISTFFTKVSSLEKKHKRVIRTIIVYTGDYITPHAETAIRDHKCQVLGQEEFRESSIVWNDFPKLKIKNPKKLREHQKKAHDEVVQKLESNIKRGKLIMACGTGKTLTSLRIAESVVGVGGTVLYLVPSITLIRQTMREWSNNALIEHYYGVVCSDSSAAGEDGSITELAYPPTTDPESLKQHFSKKPSGVMGVIFSTYHSIEVVGKAMKNKKFDLILCDESHRTTGVEDSSFFTAVHNDKIVSAEKRIYMTATPRVYSESNNKNTKNVKEVHSMDDVKTYGEVLHYYSFSEAVDQDQLTDFKVRIPIIPEEDIAKYVEEGMDGENVDGTIDERVLLAAIWHGLNYDGNEKTPLLQRAIAFSNSISASRQFAGVYSKDGITTDEEAYAKSVKRAEAESNRMPDRSFVETVRRYESNKSKYTGRTVSVRHVDGTMRAHVRDTKMRWLKESEHEPNECRILSNARCLSEGIDVPGLDGVIFLQPRRSKVDVIQSVGRVMRKAKGKNWGYVILPVIIPAGRSVGESLAMPGQKNPWRAVWQVLVALRSHNPNLANEMNRIWLEQGDSGSPSPKNVEIVWMGSLSEGVEPESFGKIVTKMVEKCGDREYFENRAMGLGEKARDVQGMISMLHQRNHLKIRTTVQKLRDGLKAIVHESITDEATIQVMAQHYALSQILNALIGEEFMSNNPVAEALNIAIRDIHLEKELEQFDDFYDEIRKEAAKFETHSGKQRYIKKIYGEFLKGFDKKAQEAHGVVYTPDEIIDFIIHSVEYILRTEFKTGLNRKDVKVFDPFTGTGAFVTRLLESGLIKPEQMSQRYKNGIYANELSLLAYYIAATNIESVFQKLSGSKKYIPFKNINYTDTLNHHPRYRLDALYRNEFIKFSGSIGKVQDKIQESNWAHIHVIIGNPPYSSGQNNFNDNNPNIKYPKLDERIKDTYVKNSKANLANSLYDSYIRSIRWASDRIGESGIIAFVTNASFIRSEAATGVRACLQDEFTDIYCFDLRGNQRTQGEISKLEGGKIFGSGSRAPVAITILVKKSKKQTHNIYYKDIGDNLTRTQKLSIIKNTKSITGIKNWITIKPDKHNDWVDQRDPSFDKYTIIGKKRTTNKQNLYAIFKTYSNGVSSSRDVWVYNSSINELENNMKRHIAYCDTQNLNKPLINSKYAKWSRGLSKNLKRHEHKFNKKQIRVALYRPFFKQYLYFETSIYIETPGLLSSIFPNNDSKNLVICVPHKFRGKFSVLMTDIMPDLHVIAANQCFPLYTYVDGEKRSNITDFALQEYHEYYKDVKITKLDIFYYVYGILHNTNYKEKFKNNLMKELPRVPMASNFWEFSKIGKKLADLHLNFEHGKKYKLGKLHNKFNKFENIRFARINTGNGKSTNDKTKLLINGSLAFENIPAINYQINGRTPLEWLVDRYKITIDKESGIINDSTNVDIVSLIERVIYIGIESDRLVSSLPQKFEPKNWKPQETSLEKHM